MNNIFQFPTHIHINSIGNILFKDLYLVWLINTNLSENSTNTTQVLTLNNCKNVIHQTKYASKMYIRYL